MINEENMLMKKIINTFKYGDKKVKRSLALAIFAGIITIGFGVAAIAISNMLCFFVAIVAAFVTISLVQTFMIAEGENPTVVAPVADIGTEESAHIEINGDKKKKQKIKPKKEMSDGGILEQDVEIGNQQQESKKDRNKKKRDKKEKNKKEKNNKENKNDNSIEPDVNTYYENSEYDENTHDEDKIKRKFNVITADTAVTYTKKKIKKTMHKYKVMKDHRMVIVDHCDRLHIYQTPAYIWIQDNQLHILLIEEEPRLLMIPLFRITEISYLKKQPVDEERDYKIFKKSTILTDSFRPYLPDYNHSNKTTDLASYKNLYGISQGIYFTNNSAKNLFDLLGVEFFVEDKVTTSNKVNIFFKEAYKANIKLRDNILDANGYADSITKILDDMAHSSISYNEFKDTLNLMIRNKLITDEYASHYMDVRNGL